MSKETKEANGIAFPLDDKGQRSTTVAAKAIWSKCLESVQGQEQAVAQLQAEKNWRHGYPPHILSIAACAAKSSDNAMAIVNAGLSAVYDTFEFVRDGKSMKLEEAMQTYAEQPAFYTGKFTGTGAPADIAMEVPLHGNTLRGDALVKQIDRWVEYGCIEPDCGAAMKSVSTDPSKIRLQGQVFVMLGAGSEIGPLVTLMRLGATVIATGTRTPARWKRLLDIVRPTPGTILFPIRSEQGSMSEEELCEAAGCDLTSDTPELLHWISKEATSGRFSRICVGNYIYMDGEAHVRVSVAMDLIVKGLVKAGKAQSMDVSVAWLGSPGTCHLIPKEAAEACVENQKNAPIWQKVLLPTPNCITPVTTADGGTVHLFDGLVVQQGPNYALAKTMQMWRAMQLREVEKVIVSAPMAPASRTHSMTHSSFMTALLDGMAHLKPCVAFDADTASAVMATLLMYHIYYPESPSYPAKPLKNPLELFSFHGFHSGYWRVPWSINSLGTVVVGLGKVWKYHPEGL